MSGVNKYKRLLDDYYVKIDEDARLRTRNSHKLEYNLLVKWHLATCERLDHQGISSHMLYICQKN